MKLGLPPVGSKPDAQMWADRMEADSPPHVPKAPHSAAERYPAVRLPAVRSPESAVTAVRSPESAVTVVRSPESAVTVCAVARDEAKLGAPRARHFEEGRFLVVRSPVVRFLVVRSPVVRSPESAVTESAVTEAATLGALTPPLASGSAWSLAETKR